MKIIKTTFLSFLLLTIITSCSNDNSLKNNLSNEGKLVNYFSTSIHSKKYQVVHLGTLIEENKNGVIIPVKSKEAVYKAMKVIISNTDMQENARKMITDRYQQEVVWNALLNEYKSL